MSAPIQSGAPRPPARVFFAAVLVMFFTSLSAADSLGFVPYYIDGSTPLTTGGSSSDTADGSTPASETSQTLALSSLPELGQESPGQSTAVAQKPAGVLPTHITIDAIGLDLPVQNPATRDIDALDALLQKGPARYVDSAKLGQSGNMIIFAHSSHLPIVHNKMFQAFNGIPNLKAGDSITITGADGKSYLYSVEKVTKADVTDGVTIDLSVSEGTRLTLVTCDTLTGKSARYILEAQFVGII